MTDLERYKELFRSTLLEFKEKTFKVPVAVGIEEREGIVENTGEVIKLNVAVYKDVDYTSLEVESSEYGYAAGAFNFDENGKLHNFTATGDY